jgi:CcmD family protein
MSYLISAYAITVVTLIAYAVVLHRERRRLLREIGRSR